MSDPLYKKELLRLAADATGAGRLERPDAQAIVSNPACGDRVSVELRLNSGRIEALAHQARACVLTQASASILAAGASGRTPAEIAALAKAVEAMLAGAEAPAPPFEAYGLFEGVATHGGRHRCVMLPLEAALRALSDAAEPGGKTA
jgi:NifU-like protein involved in Fe-S cluster formation